MGFTDHLRGALIAVALLGHGIYAIPFTQRITRTDIEQPGRQRSVEAWSRSFGQVGITVTPDELADWAVDTTKQISEAHQTLKTPYKPLFQLTNSHQGWALFASATTRPETIVIDVKRKGAEGWDPIARRLDPKSPWRADQIRYRRIRGVWDGLKKIPRPGYRNFVRWVARRAFEEFDDVTHVRIYMNRGYSTYPWRPPRPKRQTRHMWQFDRGTFETGAL